MHFWENSLKTIYVHIWVSAYLCDSSHNISNWYFIIYLLWLEPDKYSNYQIHEAAHDCKVKRVTMITLIKKFPSYLWDNIRKWNLFFCKVCNKPLNIAIKSIGTKRNAIMLHSCKPFREVISKYQSWLIFII